MKNMAKHLVIIPAAVVVTLLLALASTPSTRASGDEGNGGGVVRVTPPAPVFNEVKRREELAARRKRVAEAIGVKAILVLFSAEPRVYANDVDYPFRQENNLYYLTNLNQKRAALVLMPGHTRIPELLFLPRRDPRAETWTGHMYSPQEAAQLSGIKEIWEISEFEPFVKALRNHEAYRPKPENVLLSERSAGPTVREGSVTANSDSGVDALFAAATKNEASLYLLNFPREGESREYRQEQRFAADWTKAPAGFAIQNASPIFAQMRLRKSLMELDLLQHAIDISIEAHERAQVFASQAKSEYEVDAQVAHIFRLRNADNWGYPDIVGCGPNATTLHYTDVQGRVNQNDLLLMDVGAEYWHYTADVTRTFPVSGKFSKEQAEIYRVVYDAQEAAAKVIRPGAALSQVHNAALGVIKDGLLRLGLITDQNSNQYRVWFMHGTSHWLGMNVHDVGGGARFEPGMVFTVEPGIYIRLDALDSLPMGWSQADWEKFKAAIAPAFQKYRGIGVRIEDDVVVTPEGGRWMTATLPRSISEIEAFMAEARREQPRPASR